MSPEYQVYFLDGEDRVHHTHVLECADDAEAIARIQEMDWGSAAVELWRAERLVRRFDPAPPR